MKNKIVKYVIFMSMIFALVFGAGCATCERSCKDCSSDMQGGLPRIIRIYDMQGDLIAEYEGKIDIEDRDNSILFELDGKRYVYYNAIIEVIEKGQTKKLKKRCANLMI